MIVKMLSVITAALAMMAFAFVKLVTAVPTAK